jgi:hypothetical protein
MLGINEICGTLSNGNLANFIITSDTLFKKNTVIYENWSLGNRTILKKEPINDLRGTYNLNIEQDIRELTVNGTLEQAKCYFILQHY